MIYSESTQFFKQVVVVAGVFHRSDHFFYHFQPQALLHTVTDLIFTLLKSLSSSFFQFSIIFCYFEPSIINFQSFRTTYKLF